MYFTIKLPYFNESSRGLSSRLLQDNRQSASDAAGEKRDICTLQISLQ